MTTLSPQPDEVLAQLEKVLSSAVFEGAGRASALLRFLVTQAVDQHGERLKEYTIGTEALGREDSFDPRTDPIVRAEASRLRTRLERYYAADGLTDAIVITLPKGTYVPVFRVRSEERERASHPRWLRMTLSAGAIVMLAVVVLGLLWFRRREASSPSVAPPMQLEVELLGPGASLGAGWGTPVILSPDGQRLVFVSRRDGVTHLHQRRLDQPTPSLLRGTEGAHQPFFSPDGRWIGFWADRKLKKMPVDGGSPIDLCDAADFRGGTWSEDGTIVVAAGPGELWRLPSTPEADGSNITKFRWEGVTAAWPQVLPGGRSVLFTALDPLGADRANIEVLSLADGKRTTVIRGGTFPRYLPEGYLTYVNQGTLFAVAFDSATTRVRGAPAPVLDDVVYSSTFGSAQMDLSRTGTLVYRRSSGGGELAVAWIDPEENGATTIGRGGRYSFPRISPDGTRLALALSESGTNYVSVFDSQGKYLMRWPAPREAYGLTWTPDGTALVSGGAGGMSWVAAREDAKPQPLTRKNTIQVPSSFSPDGKRLTYHELSSSTHFDVWTVPVSTADGRLIAGTPEPYVASAAIETYPSFSPDGRWIGYTSNHSGTYDVYARPFPNDGSPPVQVSRGGGRMMHWLPNGREMVYRREDHRLMVVSYTISERSLEVQPPREWSRVQLGDTGVLKNFDIGANGRVVGLVPMSRPEERQSPNHVTMRLNFASELQQRLARAGP